MVCRSADRNRSANDGPDLCASQAVLLALRADGFVAANYKTIPPIYHQLGPEEEQGIPVLLGRLPVVDVRDRLVVHGDEPGGPAAPGAPPRTRRKNVGAVIRGPITSPPYDRPRWLPTVSPAACAGRTATSSPSGSRIEERVVREPVAVVVHVPALEQERAVPAGPHEGVPGGGVRVPVALHDHRGPILLLWAQDSDPVRPHGRIGVLPPHPGHQSCSSTATPNPVAPWRLPL